MNANKFSTTAYEEAYATLNESQKDAVDTIEGPVMVIAGPGTGKTQILTLRIARILELTDTGAEGILALTFTDAGAKAMRERLLKYIGADAYKVGIYTFHAFAERLIRDYPDSYERVIGGRPASELDKINILETILEDTQFKLLRPMGDPQYYVSPIKRKIGELKKEYVTPDTFAEIINGQEKELLGIEKIHQKGAHKGKVRGEYSAKEKSIAKNRELLSVYRLYEAALKERRLYDFEDMIVETVDALSRDENMLRDLQEKYLYVLADEHQDVNGSQNKILELLSNFHDSPNIFVVGDEKQAIFRFQGASLENFLYFKDLYKNTKQIDLTDNYRSGQRILDAAHSLVAVEDEELKRLRVPLTSKTGTEAQVELRGFSHQGIEDAWLIDAIKQELAKGTPPQEVAIIVRTNREVEQLATLLRKEGIAVEPSADSDILEHPITHAVQGFIDAVVQSHDEGALFKLLHGAYWGLSQSDVVKIANARSYKCPLIQILNDEAHLAELEVENIEAATRIATTLKAAREMDAHEAPHETLQFVLKQSGFLDHVIKTDPLESGRVIRRLYDEVEKLVLYDNAATLREVQAILSSYRDHRLPLIAPFIAGSDKAVQVMTAHKSKGLEFELVIVPHLVDKAWDGSTKRNYFDIPIARQNTSLSTESIEDERRLLYVAMTRAKNKLQLSFAEQNQEGKESVHSRLIDEIDKAFLVKCETAGEESNFNPLSKLTQSVVKQKIDASFFRTQLELRGLSATSLNNYLASPYTYLYRNVLRVPEVKTSALQFGTAIHGVMEWVSSVAAQTGEVPSVSALSAGLETQLSRLPVTKNEFVRLHEKGLEALVVYLEHARKTLAKGAMVEFKVSVVLPTGIPEFPELKLTGKLDRLDFDEERNVIRVVDYKTGKAKSRNEIEGNTKSSRGDYKRQLVFYALLLSLLEDKRYACRTGVLSFIQPDPKGDVREEVFEINTEEIEALKEQIITVTKEIISGSFLETPCDDSESEYCLLADALFLK
jgi:DNA helicase II / ATP-dependent DNA helicase PcrA